MSSRIHVYVAAGDDPAALDHGLASLWSAAERPGDVSVVVLTADPTLRLDAPAKRQQDVLVDRRADRLVWGSGARDLNWCLIDAFESWRNPTGTAWCVCAPAAAEWTPGWDRWLRDRTDLDVVIGSAAEQTFAVRLDGVLEVGFFDERFATLRSHEQDWFVRAVLRLGDRVSTDTTPILARTGAIAPEPAPHRERAAAAMLRHKWAFDDPADDHLLTPQGFAHAQSMADPPPAEIDWYPFFWDGAPLDRHAHQWFVGRRADDAAPSTSDALRAVNDLAVLAYGRGDTLGAARLLIEVLEADPTHPDAVHNLGAVLSAIGSPA